MNSSEKQRKPSVLQSVDNALAVLEMFTAENPEWGVSELSRALGISKAGIYRVLYTLQQRRFVQQNPDNEKYRLGLKCWEVGSLAVGDSGLRDVALPFLEHLRAQARETVHLAVYDDLKAVYIDILESPQPVRADSRVGGHAPAYCVATGKALLAHQPPNELQRVTVQPLPVYTGNTIYEQDKLYEHLEKVHSQGYAINRGEWRSEVCGVAAPIWNHAQEVIASVGLCVPKAHFDEDNACRMTRLVLEAAYAISGSMGAKPAEQPRLTATGS